MRWYLHDLEADFRMFYRMTPAQVAELDGPHFLRLCWRVSAYDGVVAARIEAQRPQDGAGTEVSSRWGPVDDVVAATPVALGAAGLGDLFSYGTG